jgi:hypothetical protein
MKIRVRVSNVTLGLQRGLLGKTSIFWPWLDRKVCATESDGTFGTRMYRGSLPPPIWMGIRGF